MSHESRHDPERRGGGSSGLAITALVLGVLALLTSWTIVGGILLGLGAIIVGLVALTRVKQGRGRGRQAAAVGIGAAVVGLLGAIGLVVLGVSFLHDDSGREELRGCLERAGADESAVARCEQDFRNNRR